MRLLLPMSIVLVVACNGEKDKVETPFLQLILSVSNRRMERRQMER